MRTVPNSDGSPSRQPGNTRQVGTGFGFRAAIRSCLTMNFPETRHTLIQKIALGGDNAAWREFLADYWGPVCRFASRRGNLNLQDAEDVASQVFEACLRNRLLERWADTPAAKLRTLICTVVRNVLSNRARVEGGRARLLAGQPAGALDTADGGGDESSGEQDDFFYAEWVDELLQSAVEGLLKEYHQIGRGDYFRVLYGRLCEEMSVPEISNLLRIKPTSAENYLRHARQRLAEKLQEIVHDHVHRYSSSQSEDADFTFEWAELGIYLKEHGGLEDAVRRAYQNFDPASRQGWRTRIAQGKMSLSLDSAVNPVRPPSAT